MFRVFYLCVRIWGDCMTGIGSNIRELREAAGMSQDQLGKRINKTRSAVSQYESGKIVPRMGVIEDIAHVFRVSKMDILGEKVTRSIVDINGNGGLDRNELSLLDIYRELPENGKDALMRIARDIYEAFSVLNDDSDEESKA